MARLSMKCCCSCPTTRSSWKCPQNKKVQEKGCPAIQLNALTLPQHTVSGPHMLCVKVVSIQWQSSFVSLQKGITGVLATSSWHFTLTPMLWDKATISKTYTGGQDSVFVLKTNREGTSFHQLFITFHVQQAFLQNLQIGVLHLKQETQFQHLNN